jgi:hypothetical protein
MAIITRYEYDGAGNRIAQIEALGTEVERRTEYSYNEYGQLLETVIKGGRWTPPLLQL